MATKLSLMDRLRIEGRVWSLDQQLYDLPRKRRIATRREVRSNLVSAAQSVGTRQALTNLGTSRELAEEYLTAQFGPAPRASWMAAAVFLLTAVLILTSILFDAAQAFADGLVAASPHASGVFSWPGIGYLQIRGPLHDGQRPRRVRRRRDDSAGLRPARPRRRRRRPSVATASQMAPQLNRCGGQAGVMAARRAPLRGMKEWI